MPAHVLKYIFKKNATKRYNGARQSLHLHIFSLSCQSLDHKSHISPVQLTSQTWKHDHRSYDLYSPVKKRKHIKLVKYKEI